MATGKCTYNCADGSKCGGDRGAISVYQWEGLPSLPLYAPSTLLYAEGGAPVVAGGLVEAGTEVYLQVKQGEFICTGNPSGTAALVGRPRQTRIFV